MKHLTRFTRRNTSDFFIHKDLRGFLRRELDFFIKSECLLLDELLAQEGNLTHQHILRARVVRDIGHKIIDFLAQVEDFQKRLFEKKKFVIRTEYCLTIDRVPEALWDEVLQNEAQLAEWRELYAVNPQPTKEFLRQHPTLVVDTRHFSEDFKWRLLAHFDDLDEALDGVLIKSENFQALNLLLEKYRGKVKCIYIDPPYNTGSDEFLYKDRYQHSSWLSMMADRLTLVREWLREDGAIFVSCDDHEVHHLRKIGDSLWQAIGTFVWEKKKKGSHLSPTFRDLTEYILAYTPDLGKIGKLFGEKAYSGEWQRLINRSNAERELLFPARKVHAELGDGTYQAGTYGKGEMAVHLLDDISVQDGIVQNQFRMRARFKWKQETLDKELERGSIVKLSKNMRPNVLRADQEEKTKRPPSLITKDIAAYEDAFAELNNLFGEVRYPYPKPVGLVRFFINAMTYFNPQGIVLDFFAGSGTTAHAVINLNREDSGKRKYILVEMDDWFETVMLPRIKKVVFCEKWKDGKPNGGNGVSHFLKYFYLEQYEDTLNNLELPREQEGQLALERFGDEYLLRYMLDFETQGSPCLLNLEQFQDPFAYKLKVQEGDEIKERVVDLAETFNYLLGIHVKKMRQFQDDGRLYRAVLGEKDGKRIVIVWRPLKGLNGDTAALRRDQQFIQSTVLPALLGEGKKPDRLLVNGICYVPDAEPIEPEFKRLMMGGAEVQA
ncbi:MAG: site-specific DNA-methyltransferase [Armatimonadota bacterium]|jgi:adenine-specific DNA-methyltransferase